MKKSEKPVFVDKLSAELKEAASVVLLDYTGLTVKAQQDLKKRLKKINARMEIVKNSLLKLAAVKVNTPKEMIEDSILSGPTALVISQSDPIAPLQVLATFAKEFEIPQFKVGLIEGKFQDKDSLTILSKLPSREILLSQAIGGVASPLYNMVGILQGNLQKLVYILKVKSER